MTISSLMTRDPVCCAPDQSVRDVAQMMMDHDCGEIPVVSDRDGRTLIGVVTDRDIVCRAVAAGLDMNKTPISRVMSSPVITASADMTLEECLALMESHQIRRIPVVDDGGVCGIVSQADVAVEASGQATAQLVREVSRPH